MIELIGKFTTARVWIDDVETECIRQITQMINHPAFSNPVSVMPDCHAGKGSVIGFTMAIGDQIIPNVVGVDIGCGMLSFNVGTNLSVGFEKLDTLIREIIPFGHESRDPYKVDLTAFPWEKINRQAVEFAGKIKKRWGVDVKVPEFSEKWFFRKCEKIDCNYSRAVGSIGTLGGGNHFIEIGESKKTGNYWVTIHSGSRNFGLKICEYWQKYARDHLGNLRKNELNEKIKKIRGSGISRDLISREIEKARQELGLGGTSTAKGLEALPLEHMWGYLLDMVFAQMYASANRYTMAHGIATILGVPITDEIETVHNYVDFSDLIIRKGAIRSYEGEQMIIPFNMRDGILVCEGKSNPDWNFSAPHGAGRVMSRSQAKKQLSLSDFQDQMKNVYSTSVVKETLDEAPEAYKDSEIIELSIEPTATIVDRLVPVHNMKSTK